MTPNKRKQYRVLQQTLARPVSCRGIGVHSGRHNTVTIKPAPENHGIKFRRLDIPGTHYIQALFNMVVDTSLATVIGTNGAIVSTIEHLMATFAGLGIDNALVEVENYELPVMDGSAKDFTFAVLEGGIVEQEAERQFFWVKEPVHLKMENKSVSIYPSDTMKITCSIDFDHPLIGRQEITFDHRPDTFSKEICRARTFGFVKDLEYLKKFSLGRGGSLENAVVLDEEKVLNNGGLRYENELVRHKLLDSLGDFSLLGMPIFGHIVTDKSGHALNHMFITKFLKTREAWETGPCEKERYLLT
ncbi:MAG: UDP-3-O-acyl-N-acetylglucosamine deacetylase [Desulfobacteraceae bacterium]